MSVELFLTYIGSLRIEMVTKQEELRDRAKRFAIAIVKLFRLLPKTDETRVIGK